MTRAAANEYAYRNIRVNALCPGVIETPRLANATDAARREVIQTIPMGRTGMPEEMASVALFLASPAASYVTGVGLLADGGRNAGRCYGSSPVRDHAQRPPACRSAAHPA